MDQRRCKSQVRLRRGGRARASMAVEKDESTNKCRSAIIQQGRGEVREQYVSKMRRRGER